MRKKEMGFVVLFILLPCMRRAKGVELFLNLGGGLAGVGVGLVAKVVCAAHPRCFLWAVDRAVRAIEMA